MAQCHLWYINIYSVLERDYQLKDYASVVIKSEDKQHFVHKVRFVLKQHSKLWCFSVFKAQDRNRQGSCPEFKVQGPAM